MRFSKLNWRMREFVFAIARPLFHVGIRATSNMTGKLRPLAERGGTVVLAGKREDVPSSDLWIGYAETGEEFLSDGRADMDAVVALLASNRVALPGVVLDLGCGAARMTRHFPRSGDSEIWGADISAPTLLGASATCPTSTLSPSAPRRTCRSPKTISIS